MTTEPATVASNESEEYFESSVECIDLYRVGNVIRLDSNLNNHLHNLVFPFFLVASDADKYYIRTETRGMELGESHPMTVDEARALVGRKIYIYNDGVSGPGTTGGLMISLGLRLTETDDGFVDFGPDGVRPNNFSIPSNTMWAFECCSGFYRQSMVGGGIVECIYWRRAVLDDNVTAFVPLNDSDFANL